MTKTVTWIVVAALTAGGIASWDLIPKPWFDRLPALGQIALVTCAVIFSAIMVLGYVLDSGIVQKIFKKK